MDHLYQDPHEDDVRFRLHYGDLTDSTNLIRLVQEIRPDEIYNLAAMSHVAVSFDTPEYTANADAVGTLRLLEAVRILGLEDCRFYQASTSELYGKVVETPQSETTPFYPRSPYGVAKLYAYWIVVNYREAYGMHASNGILFNHESPRRGETFVTRKITRAVAKISLGLQDTVYLGNLDAKRDWGHARDYVEGMWRMVQHETPGDWVLATGETTTVRDFCRLAFEAAGLEVAFEGEGEAEVARRTDTGAVVLEVDPSYYRPTEVELFARRRVQGRARARVDPDGDGRRAGPRDGRRRPGRVSRGRWSPDRRPGPRLPGPGPGLEGAAARPLAGAAGLEAGYSRRLYQIAEWVLHRDLPSRTGGAPGDRATSRAGRRGARTQRIGITRPARASRPGTRAAPPSGSSRPPRSTS